MLLGSEQSPPVVCRSKPHKTDTYLRELLFFARVEDQEDVQRLAIACKLVLSG